MIYDTLPPSVATICVSNASLCPTGKETCFVNRPCAVVPGNLFQAIGDFSDYRNQALTLTGRNEPVDWSTFVLPQSVNQLTFTKFQQIVLLSKFQWPQNLSSLRIYTADSLTFPTPDQVPQLKDLSLRDAKLKTVPAQLPPGLTILNLTNVTLDQWIMDEDTFKVVIRNDALIPKKTFTVALELDEKTCRNSTAKPTKAEQGNHTALIAGSIAGSLLHRVDERELTLESLLGSGAFAKVWRGTFRGEPVAVKASHDHRVDHDHVQAFIQEIQLMGSFDSPYIVRLLGVVWTRPADLKCIMEYMDCGDLKEYLADNSPEELSWTDKVQHIYCVIEGLGTKLADFGISKEDIQATMTVGVGTFRWMAPEVIQSQYYTTSSDIYSFGVLLSEFSTHQLPYQDMKNPSSGLSMGDTSIMVKVVSGELRPLFSEDCPHWIKDLAEDCLALDPAKRPTAAQRFLSQITD
ncbi:unnamed protein product [Aphanomyces euteiches]